MAIDLNPRTNIARSMNGMLANDATHAFQSWSHLMQVRDAEGERPWMIYVDASGRRTVWSYAVFIDVARRIATLLVTNGVGTGDRVAIAGHNHPDTILQYFACWMIGACAVPLNMTEDDARLSYILSASKTRIVFCRSEYRNRVVAALGACNLEHAVQILEVDTDSADPEFYATVRACNPHPWDDVPIDRRFDDCLLVYTSGTTGNPKGVVLMQQNLFADACEIGSWHGIGKETRMMCVLPVHHVNGTIVTTVTPFVAGSSVVLQRKFSATSFFDTIKAEGVHLVSVVPTLLAFLLEAKADASDILASGFRHFICGAGPLTVELATAFEERYGLRIVHGYGLSETTCYSCFLPLDLSWDQHRSWMKDYGFPSIGVPLPCNEMAIHDASGNPVPEGERGEIVIRGVSVMREYDTRPEANEDCFAFGWFRSGDEGFMKVSSDGRTYFFITGRLKELIIRGGVNLAPLEIDEVLAGAPGVKAGICVGFPNNMYGEEVGALVVSDGSAKEEAILAYCSERLPFHKRPKVVVFTTELPVTSTGKYQRNKVKHLFDAYLDVQFRQQ